MSAAIACTADFDTKAVWAMSEPDLMGGAS